MGGKNNAVRVNGVLHRPVEWRKEEFKPTRGIRQGDPISPYLFLFAAEGLSCLLKDNNINENVKGVVVSPTAPPVNHLLFADDCLLMFKANMEGATVIRDTIQRYCEASGQRVNLSKSSIFFGKGCPNDRRSEIKTILEVSNESLSERYLGLPTDVGKSKNKSFKYIKDRLWGKVKGWIERCMAGVGKEILIKSVAQAVPTFSMNCFLLPRGLCQQIDTMLRKFFWGSKEGKRKVAWVSWEVLTMPKYMGGLGFRDTQLFNLAMLAKQAWRIIQDPQSLSARILKSVYFPTGEMLDAELGTHPSQVWRALFEGKAVLKQGLIRRIGNGRAMNIWADNWLPRNNMLRVLHPRSDDPPSLVADLMDESTRSWNQALVFQHMQRPDADIILNIPLSSKEFG